MSLANRFGRGLVAAMESENADTTPVDEVLAADSAESSLVDATDAGAAVDAEVADIESAQADSDTLGEIADTLESSEEAGGLDPLAAQLAEVAIESIYNRLGVSRKEKPALESFADKSTRVRATRVAVEDIKATMKKIWEAIVAAFGRVVDWLKNFFAAIFDSNDKLAQRADALEKKARGTTGELASDTMPAGNTAKALATGGSFDKAGVLKTVDALAASVKKIGSKSSGADFKDIKGLVQDQAKFDALTVAAFGGDGYSDTTEEAGAGLKVVVSPAMPGNKVVRLVVPAKEATGAEALEVLGKMSAQVVTDGKAAEAKLETVPVLNAQEAGKLAGSVRGLTKAVLETRKAQNALETKIKSLTADARSAATLAPKEDEAGAAARARQVSKAITASLNFEIKHATVLVSVATGTAKAALDYAERSLGQYKAKKEEKAAA